jgi:hypothetical protein
MTQATRSEQTPGSQIKQILSTSRLPCCLQTRSPHAALLLAHVCAGAHCHFPKGTWYGLRARLSPFFDVAISKHAQAAPVDIGRRVALSRHMGRMTFTIPSPPTLNSSPSISCNQHLADLDTNRHSLRSEHENKQTRAPAASPAKKFPTQHNGVQETVEFV